MKNKEGKHNMTEIYLIRHGQTTWNNERRFQGHTDIELDKEGIAQANRLKERLRDVHFDAFYSSDLIRANKTANIVAQDRGMPVHILKEVKEIKFGEWEGKKFSEVMGGEQNFKKWHDDSSLKMVPGGERAEEVLNRVEGAIQHILRVHPKERVAVFSHGGPIRYMLISCLKMPIEMCWKIDIGNTSISVMRWENNNFHLHCINDCAHL
ncbi:alpha-ribazole phosphatase [Clostridia bacterium]|nr:alpha-ribazole phosphatase [Clostridia bacterium]